MPGRDDTRTTQRGSNEDVAAAPRKNVHNYGVGDGVAVGVISGVAVGVDVGVVTGVEVGLGVGVDLWGLPLPRSQPK